MWGLRPVGDDLDISGWQGPSYFQEFDVIEYASLPASTLTIDTREGDAIYSTDFSYEVDFDIGFGVRENISITAPVVFAGYGLDVPEEDYHELKNVTIKDRIVLLLQGVPREDDDSLVWNKSGQRTRYAGLRARLSRLREEGAAGILLVQSRQDRRDRSNPNAGIHAADNTNQVSVTVSEQLPMLERITKKNNEHTGLDIDMRVTDVTGGGSDHVPFARGGIPVSFFFTGFHEDYHQPTDTVDKINFEKMTRIVRLAYLNLWELANYEGDFNIAVHE